MATPQSSQRQGPTLSGILDPECGGVLDDRQVGPAGVRAPQLRKARPARPELSLLSNTLHSSVQVRSYTCQPAPHLSSGPRTGWPLQLNRDS